MHRMFVLTFGLLLLFVTCASAEIYRCRTPDGELVMTDRKDKLPADCRPVDEPTETGSFNVVPSVPSAPVNDNESQPAYSEPVDTPDVLVDQDGTYEINRSLTPHEVHELRKHKKHSDLPRNDLPRVQQLPDGKDLDKSPRR